MTIETAEMSKELLDQYSAAFSEAAPAPEAGAGNEEAGEPALEEGTPAEPENVPGETGEKATETPETEPLADKTAGDGDEKNGTEKPALTAEEEADAALEVQRLKSWEGRLKKKEAEQKARDEALAAEAAVKPGSDGATPDAAGAQDPEAAIGAVADQVADGTLTASQAMKQVSADFGEDFVKMIKVIVAAEAAEVGSKAVASVKGEVDGLTKHMASAAEAAHFERIEAAHPDFNEIRMSPEFAAFVESADPENQRIANGGNAKEVIRLLKTYKASKPAPAAAAKPAPQAEPEGVDAAAGVRSGGLQLPTPAASNDDYDSAFAEAAAMSTK